MPFGLKNACTVYQRLIDVVFSKKIGQDLEVYINDMILKILEGENHSEDLEDILESFKCESKKRLTIGGELGRQGISDEEAPIYQISEKGM